MRTEGQTFWLLNGSVGWGDTALNRVSQGAVSGIRLDGAPGGPLSLLSNDESVGGLALPQRMTLDSTNLLYLLTSDLWIKRFDPASQTFVRLPYLGGAGRDPRQFQRPSAIAIARQTLYVADAGGGHVKGFALPSLALRYLWGPFDGVGRAAAPDSVDAWEPVDLFAANGVVTVLDRRHGNVYRQTPGGDGLTLILSVKEAANRWSRLLVDATGSVYLLDADRVVDGVPSPRLDIYDSSGKRLGEKLDAGDVRDQFEAPPITLRRLTNADQGHFCLPESLAKPCDRRPPEIAPQPERPLSECAGLPGLERGSLAFDGDGQPVRIDPAEPYGPALYVKSGTWTSGRLDSSIYACQWHRIELELDALPSGTQLKVLTRGEPTASDVCSSDADTEPLYDGGWKTAYVVSGQMQSPPPSKPGSAKPADRGASAAGSSRHEFLVQSQPGQFLTVRLVLSGDGYATPVVRSLRVHYPRESYLQFLPAIFSADPCSAWFMQRFLSIFQTEMESIQRINADIAGYFDPKAVPDGPFLEYLAAWLALPLEGDWSDAQKRRLLVAAPKLLAIRGTPAGLVCYLRVVLQNISGVAPEAQGQYPVIVERFRERDRLLLGMLDGTVLGQAAPLWSASVMSRMQLGVFSREGEAALVSTGDPQHDLFTESAHRFRVYIPSAWIKTKKDEQQLRRALDSEKPAHTLYDLHLVEPRFLIGVQSTIGLDTIIGGVPETHLAGTGAPATPEDALTAPPEAQQPIGLLGYDTVLSASPTADTVMHLTRETRIGAGTTLQ